MPSTSASARIIPTLPSCARATGATACGRRSCIASLTAGDALPMAAWCWPPRSTTSSSPTATSACSAIPRTIKAFALLATAARRALNPGGGVENSRPNPGNRCHTRLFGRANFQIFFYLPRRHHSALRRSGSAAAAKLYRTIQSRGPALPAAAVAGFSKLVNLLVGRPRYGIVAAAAGAPTPDRSLTKANRKGIDHGFRFILQQDRHCTA